MTVAVIEYNSGNTFSVMLALQRLGINALLTDKADEIETADRIILPGVGAAGSAMQYLRQKNMDRLITGLKQPVLGICLGMQLLCSHSEEGNVSCIGIFNHNVKRFEVAVKVPQMGWNNITSLASPLFRGIADNEYMYFVHSYYVPRAADAIAIADYNGLYTAAIQKDNFYAVQFHPEKSGAMGQLILENFISL